MILNRRALVDAEYLLYSLNQQYKTYAKLRKYWMIAKNLVLDKTFSTYSKARVDLCNWIEVIKLKKYWNMV